MHCISCDQVVTQIQSHSWSHHLSLHQLLLPQPQPSISRPSQLNPFTITTIYWHSPMFNMWESFLKTLGSCNLNILITPGLLSSHSLLHRLLKIPLKPVWLSIFAMVLIATPLSCFLIVSAWPIWSNSLSCLGPQTSLPWSDLKVL